MKNTDFFFYRIIVSIVLLIVLLISSMFLFFRQNKSMTVDTNEIVEFNGKFNLIERINNYEYIVFDKDTYVIYYINRGQSIGITPLYNSDGTIQIYDNK